MTTGLTPDFQPNLYQAALRRAAHEAEQTAASFTDDGGHPLHRELARLEHAWTSTGGTRTLFTIEAENVSRGVARALQDHADTVRQSASREPSVVDPAGPQGWKSRDRW